MALGRMRSSGPSAASCPKCIPAEEAFLYRQAGGVHSLDGRMKPSRICIGVGTLTAALASFGQRTLGVEKGSVETSIASLFFSRRIEGSARSVHAVVGPSGGPFSGCSCMYWFIACSVSPPPPAPLSIFSFFVGLKTNSKDWCGSVDSPLLHHVSLDLCLSMASIPRHIYTSTTQEESLHFSFATRAALGRLLSTQLPLQSIRRGERAS